MKPQVMWAVKFPDGGISHIYEDATMSKFSFMRGTVTHWGWFEDNGYRIVKVQVTEIKEGKE